MKMVKKRKSVEQDFFIALGGLFSSLVEVSESVADALDAYDDVCSKWDGVLKEHEELVDVWTSEFDE